jgi:hypothetical protein
MPPVCLLFCTPGALYPNYYNPQVKNNLKAIACAVRLLQIKSKTEKWVGKYFVEI